MPSQVESLPHLHQPSSSSASASAEERRLHRHQPTSADDRRETSADVCRRARVRGAGGGGEGNLPDWEVLELLTRFWERFPSTRFQQLWLFLRHVVLLSKERHADMGCRDPEEWANLAFSSAMIFTCRNALGEVPYGRGPMAHFLWALKDATRFELQHGFTANLDVLAEHLLDAGAPLEQLLELDERPPRRPPPPPEPERSRSTTMRGIASAAAIAVAAAAPSASSGETPPLAPSPASSWARRPTPPPVTLSAARLAELEGQARLEADYLAPAGIPCRDEVHALCLDRALKDLTRSALEEELARSQEAARG